MKGPSFLFFFSSSLLFLFSLSLPLPLPRFYIDHDTYDSNETWAICFVSCCASVDNTHEWMCASALHPACRSLSSCCRMLVHLKRWVLGLQTLMVGAARCCQRKGSNQVRDAFFFHRLCEQSLCCVWLLFIYFTSSPSPFLYSKGTYQIRFEVQTYFDSSGRDAFYPFCEITFIVKDPSQHFHVPLLL